ncbi:hypothetical protein RZ571_000114 [Acinetobacter baumannii]|nr:hypothetical protein [Acinetobacter baumannii]EKV1040573.1 hypothetical protein [Acinetobacter baumannii]EKV1044302.1 hypothetical protein [Acinetobacter baumannii]EKV1917762.1 hypothetical protein [Acinetobacter baumannii]EKV1921690.1 hypothetical protein [Acinetobacter baumannii]
MNFFKLEDRFEDFIELDSKSENFNYYKCKDENEEFFFIKTWKKITQKPVKELWLQELRNLIYLRNNPNSSKYLMLINDAHDFNNYFIMSYKCQSNDIPYPDYIEKYKNWNNSKYFKEDKNRLSLWKNIYNLASGLEILHENKMLHRNISKNSIIVSSEKDSPENFRLTGFEWILELATFKYDEELVQRENSFSQDWENLFKLCLELFNYDSIKDLDIFSNTENYFFKSNIYKKNILIKNKILEIINHLEIENTNKNEKNYSLKISKLKIDIYVQKMKESSEIPDINDLNSSNFHEYIHNDINKKSKINIIKATHYRNRTPVYFLHGNHFFYQINGSTDISSGLTWEKAVLLGVFPNLPNFAKFDKTSIDFDININIINSTTERKFFSNWQPIINKFNNNQELEEPVKHFINSMLIAQAIDISEYYSNIFNVKTSIVDLKEKLYLKIKLKENIEDNKLSKALQKDNPASRFEEEIKNPLITEWIISNKKPENKNSFFSSLKEIDRTDNFRLRIFYSHKNSNFEYYFYTKIDSEFPESLDEVAKYIKDEMYIYSKNLNGTFTSIIRKNKSLNNLYQNIPLIKSIITPREETKIFTKKIDYIESYNELDEPKREVFNNIFQTYPNYIVQGPPGVGKTFLIKNIVEQIFKNEPFSKVILSAQSHSTVEVLYNEIKSSKFNNDLIWLNAFNKDDDDDFFTDTIEKYITPIFDSKLWKNSYSKNTDIISEMDDFKKIKNKYSLYSKIISSANIIFTTTNSRIIEDLIHNKVQFDWSIMEESAKASGHELISPLLLSFKRILIGDHKQLPPFSEKSITKILNPSNINIDIILEKITNGVFKNKLAYTSGLKSFIDTYLEINSAIIKDQNSNLNPDETVTNEELLLNLIENVYHPTIESTLKYYSLFKHLYSKTVELKKIKAVINFGSMVNRQYRMHPQISKVVSEVFYDSDLLNNEDQENYYSNNDNKPFFFNDINSINLNNKNRVIWIDIPEPFDFEKKVTCFEKHYINMKEVSIIEKILNSVKCNNNILKPPSIAILSPYAKQVNLINNEFIGKGMAKEITSKGFKIFSETEIAKTVDSFQGGESDLVLVSLVKHNNANNIRAALGFLLDERRMNVLLSRAKHQLIIVGSLGMFKYWLDPISANANLSNNHSFINHFVNMIENDKICSIIDCREIGVSLENY